MSTDTQNRHPAGSPTGGQFATTARTEGGVTLAPPASDDPERRVDAELTASLEEGIGLERRIRSTRSRVGDARQRHTVHAALDGPSRALDAERDVVEAEADLQDLQQMKDSTLPGLAVLQGRYDEHRRAGELMASVGDHGEPDRLDHHREQARWARDAIVRATDVTDLLPVGGGPHLPADTARLWSKVAMVALPVRDDDSPNPIAYRVAFIATDTEAELGRATLHTALCEDHRSGELDKGAVIDAVTLLAKSGRQDGDASAARALLDHVEAAARAA